MSAIGSLAVNIVGNSEGFTRATRSARGEMKLFQSGIGAMKGALAGFGAAIAAGFTISALKGAAAEVDQLAKDSIRLGIATDKLQGLERFAEVSGASASDVVAGLSKMEVAINKGAASFAKLKLSAVELRNLKPEEAFIKIADAIQKMPNANERMAAVKDIFGKGGASLLPTIMEGGGAIGAGMGRFGTVTEDQAKKIQEANDAATELGFAFQDLKTLLVAGLAPAITDVLKTITGLLSGKPDANGLVANGLMGTPGVTRGAYSDTYDALLGKMSDADFKKLQHDYKQRDRELEKTNDGERLGELVQRMTGLSTGQFNATTFETAMQQRQDRMNAASVAKHRELGVDDPERVRKENEAREKQVMEAGKFMFGMMNGSVSRNVDEFAGQDDMKALAEQELDKLNKRQKQIQQDSTQVTTSTALEKGTAAAFSQERRSGQAGQMLENAKKQLAELKGAREQLKKIANTGLGKFPVYDLSGGT